MIKLRTVKKLKGEKKKYAAVFEKNGKEYIRKFGAAGMSDFTIHKDTERRERYISRHKKDLRTGDPMRAGYLSMYILWNKPSLQASITDYKRRLNVYNKTGKFPKDIKGSKKLSFGVRLVKVAKDIPGPLGFILQGDLAKGIEETSNAMLIQEQLRNTILKDRSPKTKLIRELVREGIKNSKRSREKRFLKYLALNVSPLERWGSLFLRSLSELKLEENDFKPDSLFYKILLSSINELEEYREDLDSDDEAREDPENNYYVISTDAVVDILQQITPYAPWDTDTRDDLENLKETSNWLRNDWLEKFTTIYRRNYFGTPDNVVNKKLYESIKKKIRKSIKGRRWGAYDSGRLVREYKAKGGKYRGSKGKTDLGRWYKEKWVDACAWPKRKACGRKTKESIAYCRPSKRIDSKTPKLVQKLTKAQIKSRCDKKKKNPMKKITKFGNYRRLKSGNYMTEDEYLPFNVNWTIHCTFIPGIGNHVTIRNQSVSLTFGGSDDHAFHYGIKRTDQSPEFWGTGQLRRYLYQLPENYKKYMKKYYNTKCENIARFPVPLIGESPYKYTSFPPQTPRNSFGSMHSVALLKRFLRENPKDPDKTRLFLLKYIQECKTKYSNIRCTDFIKELLLNFYYSVENKRIKHYKDFNPVFKKLVREYKKTHPNYTPYKFNLDKTRILRFSMYLHILQDEPPFPSLLGKGFIDLPTMITSMT